MRVSPFALVALLVPGAGFAQVPDAEGGRFVLRETPAGLLRMDTRSGAISICGTQGGTFACRLAPDDRTALEGEVARLKAENEQLRRQAPNPAPPAAQIPSDQEVDRMLSLAERVWKRFMDMMRQTEQEQGRRL